MLIKINNNWGCGVKGITKWFGLVEWLGSSWFKIWRFIPFNGAGENPHFHVHTKTKRIERKEEFGSTIDRTLANRLKKHSSPEAQLSLSLCLFLRYYTNPVNSLCKKNKIKCSMIVLNTGSFRLPISVFCNPRPYFTCCIVTSPTLINTHWLDNIHSNQKQQHSINIILLSTSQQKNKVLKAEAGDDLLI